MIRPTGPLGLPVLRPAAERAGQIDQLVGSGRAERFGRTAGPALDDLDRVLVGSPDVAVADQAVTAAVRAITIALEAEFRVDNTRLADLLEPRIDPTELAASVRDRARDTWRVTPREGTRTVDVRVFDPGRAAELLGAVDRLRSRLPDPADTVEVVTGYEIRRRDGGPFAVAIAAAGAMYTVDGTGETYRLRVRGADRAWTAHDLPADLVASVPAGEDRADRLRAALVVAPRSVRRPRTTEEKAAVADTYETGATLYTTSVLAASEYTVRSTGGRRGPYTLADLLRDPVTGVYAVPSGPTLLGGFRTRLLDAEVRMAGLVVADDAEPGLFLHGHGELAAEVGDLTLRAEGDFIAAAGGPWTAVPLPSGTPTSGDVIGFSGHVAVLQGTRTAFEGSAEGTFRRTADNAVFADLSVHVTAQGSGDLGVADTELARIGWSFDGELEVSLRPGDLDVAATVDLGVTVEVMTYEVRFVEDIPPQTVCALWPDEDPDTGELIWVWECRHTPAIGHPEVDFSNPEWASVARGECSVDVRATNSTITFDVNLDELGGDVVDLLGPDPLRLTGLI